MPATQKSISSKVNTIDIEVDGDPKGITVSYSTRKVTPRMLKQVQEGINTGLDPIGLDSTIDQMLMVVTEWNYALDDDQPPVPLTKDGLLDVSVDVLAMVIEAVSNDQSPKGKTDGSSNTP